MSNTIKINSKYEILQIIRDFGEPLEIFREAIQNAYDEDATKIICHVYENQKIIGNELIIDIFNNGNGLPTENIPNFFDLANSTKVNKDLIPNKNKIGYKGHGAKIFFNSTRVIVTSKTTKGEYFSVTLDSPIEQIANNSEGITYSDPQSPDVTGVKIPSDWQQGFYVRIIGHLHFRTQHTKFKLNHKNLRDYCKWYSVLGTVRTYFDETLKNRQMDLLLRAFDCDSFINQLSPNDIDPMPMFETIDGHKYEKITMGHYFPPERATDKAMKDYAKAINSNKAYYEYFSKIIYRKSVSCSDGTTCFNLIISLEGYETKRRYDILLTGRGRSRTEISHTDSDRYGIWACKGGIPVEKIDSWIEGSKGTHTYLQAFVDSDSFNLTANRGSIHNSDIEVIDLIKKKVSEIFNSTEIKSAINERIELEDMEKRIESIEEDGKALAVRHKASNSRKKIKIGDHIFYEPRRLTKGFYSESETLILLIQLMELYPGLFTFQLLDHNTKEGIDFVVLHQSNPKYIELKGSFTEKINHPFRYIYKFICYEVAADKDSIVGDIENFEAKLVINSDDKFISYDENFKLKKYRSYNLQPLSAYLPSMEIIELKTILQNVLGATIE